MPNLRLRSRLLLATVAVATALFVALSLGGDDISASSSDPTMAGFEAVLEIAVTGDFCDPLTSANAEQFRTHTEPTVADQGGGGSIAYPGCHVEIRCKQICISTDPGTGYYCWWECWTVVICG